MLAGHVARSRCHDADVLHVWLTKWHITRRSDAAIAIGIVLRLRSAPPSLGNAARSPSVERGHEDDDGDDANSKHQVATERPVGQSHPYSRGLQRERNASANSDYPMAAGPALAQPLPGQLARDGWHNEESRYRKHLEHEHDWGAHRRERSCRQRSIGSQH